MGEVFLFRPRLRPATFPRGEGFLEICHLGRLQLKLQFIRNQRNKFRIRGFSLGIADGIAEKSLQRIQITTIPGYLNGMADGTFYTAGGGLECFRHLGIQYLCDGVSLPDGKQGGFRAQSENAGFHK